ncbi:unnamed protein product [Rangifer tarandus platyrhynchus]|uniref:Uncharacterized protein n=1 Tax=Rangifer tarandus platyrhynchus TaxID=3082113 RepID=A0AC60A2H0_RANTA
MPPCSLLFPFVPLKACSQQPPEGLIKRSHLPSLTACPSFRWLSLLQLGSCDCSRAVQACLRLRALARLILQTALLPGMQLDSSPKYTGLSQIHTRQSFPLNSLPKRATAPCPYPPTPPSDLFVFRALSATWAMMLFCVMALAGLSQLQ